MLLTSFRLSIPTILEKQSSYVILAEQDMIVANINNRTNKQGPIKLVDKLAELDDFCWHNVNLIIDPRQSKSLWQTSKVRNKNIYKKRYVGKRAMYVSEVYNEEGSGIVSSCDRALMENVLNTKQLRFAEINKCCDGTIGFAVLPHYYNINLQTQIFLCISKSQIFICGYTEHNLDHFSHIILDNDVADLRSIVLHDVIPILREYKVLEHGERLSIISFGQDEDNKIIDIICNDLKIKGVQIENSKSFEYFILATTLHAINNRIVKITDYFNQISIPIIPWSYTQLASAILILSYVIFTAYYVREQISQKDIWQARHEQSVVAREESMPNFIAVKAGGSDNLQPNLDKIFAVLLHDVPNNIWLQSLLVQFDKRKFIIQGWARALSADGSESANIYDFTQLFAKTINVPTSDIRIYNTDGRKLTDLMQRKVSARSSNISITPSTFINLSNADNNNSMLAIGFQASNLKEDEKLVLVPTNIGSSL